MSTQKKIAIQLTNASKTYILHHQKPTLSEQFLRPGKKQKFTALNKINLSIFQGEKVGIVGKNGSGKTTLLKVIAGISTLNNGTIATYGKVVSLIDVSAGFQPDMSGNENIFLNGLVIGMSRNEIEKKYKSIVQFADIGSFVSSPLYTYSEGMKLRLGFAIAVHSDPDILILDEGVNAGDNDFQKKVSQRIEAIFNQGKTVLVVSHWLEYLEKNCNRFLWLEKGKVKKSGAKKILKQYAKET